MVLRLRVRICFRGRCVETLGIAATGFSGSEPEITLPQDLAKNFVSESLVLTLSEKILADGSRSVFAKTMDRMDLYLLTEDGVRGPVKVVGYITREGPVLLNDVLLSSLRIVIIDPKEGIYCFREELGSRERRGA